MAAVDEQQHMPYTPRVYYLEHPFLLCIDFEALYPREFIAFTKKRYADLPSYTLSDLRRETSKSHVKKERRKERRIQKWNSGTGKK